MYLDSYRNRDPRKNGESADGFAVKEGSGTGNVLRGARLWDNVDDGLDFWYVHILTSPIHDTYLFIGNSRHQLPSRIPSPGVMDLTGM